MGATEEEATFTWGLGVDIKDFPAEMTLVAFVMIRTPQHQDGG